MSGHDLTESQITAMARLAVQIADRAAVADIECNAVHDDSPGDGLRWLDVRPMVDEREHGPEAIDMARDAIDYVLLATWPSATRSGRTCCASPAIPEGPPWPTT